MTVAVTHVEIAALLAAAQYHAFGQPPGSQLRATVLGRQLAAAAGVDAAEQATAWWTSALRFLGCTGHAFDMAVGNGDDIELRGRGAPSRQCPGPRRGRHPRLRDRPRPARQVLRPPAGRPRRRPGDGLVVLGGERRPMGCRPGGRAARHSTR